MDTIGQSGTETWGKQRAFTRYLKCSMKIITLYHVHTQTYLLQFLISFKTFRDMFKSWWEIPEADIGELRLNKKLTL